MNKWIHMTVVRGEIKPENMLQGHKNVCHLYNNYAIGNCYVSLLKYIFINPLLS
jgi:hypothetical protein